ncbi:sugar transferase [Notoacmeibacter sp. MSK16QG-6]|uniref:sugar transferase n=1 Tax=Notoacmeibacter sp. MSK16QG-6 TaxID=2957982 RepID=UPI0020A1D7F6|nr:sugar transferase [Notoacmeibacter sp. MSK16QG-6]MCP1198056.1 sugar transferase [Notoacmeibacter sp. MSK16QG-6]
MKRLLDIFGAGLGLILLSPIIILSICAIKIDGGPVFFKQERVGLAGRIFQVYKLRSMIVNADHYLDAQGEPTRERVTTVGKIIRKLSIDELPQLLNILIGDMSLIGPRPILPQMLPYLTVRERGRFALRPGVTGLAQVKGRNHIKWSRRFHYDLIYVRHNSIALDLWIFWRTLKIVVVGDGVAHDRNSGQVDDITIRPLQAHEV